MSTPIDGLTPEERAAVSHWADYGQKGVTPNHRVLSWQYKANDFISTPASEPWEVALYAHQLPVLLFGFCPTKSRSELDPDDFIVGDTMRTHGFMSTSKDRTMIASEDKWFVYAKGPDADGNASLHMHRSWSGAKMIELTLDCGSIGGEQLVSNPSKITNIKWDSGPNGTLTVDKAKKMAQTVCSWVLSVDIGVSEHNQFPREDDWRSSDASEL